MLEIRSTKDTIAEQGLKFLVYGTAGVGKTHLCSTTGDTDHTLIVSAEGGMVTLAHVDIDVVEVRTLDDLRRVLGYLQGGDHDYTWVCVDSISEVAEVILEHALKTHRDGRQAYGEMGTKVISLLRQFRNLPQHVYMTAEEIEDDGQHAPSMPGNKAQNKLAHIFDFVFNLRVAEQAGEMVRYLQTSNDGRFIAKDRSGALDAQEPADLAAIVDKIQSASEGRVEAREPKQVESDAAELEYDREKDDPRVQKKQEESLAKQRNRFHAMVSEAYDGDGDKVDQFREFIKGAYAVESFNDIGLGKLRTLNNTIDDLPCEDDSGSNPRREWINSKMEGE